jgi:hypothetical protein
MEQLIILAKACRILARHGHNDFMQWRHAPLDLDISLASAGPGGRFRFSALGLPMCSRARAVAREFL